MVESVSGLGGRWRSGSDGGVGVGEAPTGTGYVSYVSALLFLEFINKNSSFANYQ